MKVGAALTRYNIVKTKEAKRSSNDSVYHALKNHIIELNEFSKQFELSKKEYALREIEEWEKEEREYNKQHYRKKQASKLRKAVTKFRTFDH